MTTSRTSTYDNIEQDPIDCPNLPGPRNLYSPCTSCKTIRQYTNILPGTTTFTIPLPCEVKGRIIAQPIFVAGPILTITTYLGETLTITSATALNDSFSFFFNLTTVEGQCIRCYNIEQVVFVNILLPVAGTCDPVTVNVYVSGLGPTTALVPLSLLTACSCQDGTDTAIPLTAVAGSLIQTSGNPATVFLTTNNTVISISTPEIIAENQTISLGVRFTAAEPAAELCNGGSYAFTINLFGITP